MQLHGKAENTNVPENLKPLFEAMCEGKTIAQIWFFSEKKQPLLNIVATDYWRGLCWSASDGYSDYVDAINAYGKPCGFYMSWVRDYRL